ncbi:MAG: alpha/beta hydrolase family protein [Acidobacteriaceae bacterium]
MFVDTLLPPIKILPGVARSSRLAEPAKAGVTGTSYGVYSDRFFITRYPLEMVTASAPVCRKTDLVVDYNTTRSDMRTHNEEVLGGRPDQVPEHYPLRSPIHKAQDISAKLLFFQSALDPNVSPENVHQERAAPVAYSFPFSLLVFDDEEHRIEKPDNQELIFPQIADFFVQALMR